MCCRFFTLNKLVPSMSSPRGGGGGLLPYIGYVDVLLQRVWFLTPFGPKSGKVCTLSELGS